MTSLILLIIFLQKDKTVKPMRFENFLFYAVYTAFADLIGILFIFTLSNGWG